MSIRRRFVQGNEDLTFVFHLRNEFVRKVSIYDNILESEIKLDDISTEAETYYIQQIIDLTKQSLKQKQSA